jgi:hypothetical protein
MWNPRLSKQQARIINHVCNSILARYLEYESQFEDLDLDSEGWDSYDGIEKLVKLLFPQNFLSHIGLNRAAVDYQPLTLPEARGKRVTEHPTSVLAKDEFENIKKFCLGPSILKDFRVKARVKDTATNLPWTMDGDSGKTLKETKSEGGDSDESEDEDTSAAPFDEDEDDEHDGMEISEIELREDLFDDLGGLGSKMSELMADREAKRVNACQDSEKDSEDDDEEAMDEEE